MPLPLEALRAALADRYTITSELGAGGTATVYLARDIRHDRDADTEAAGRTVSFRAPRQAAGPAAERRVNRRPAHQKWMQVVHVAGVLACQVVTACTGERLGGYAPVTSDSAGIQLIAYPQSSSFGRAVQRVDSVPLFSIVGGSLEASSAIGPVVQHDGGIVVGDRVLKVIFFFDSLGTLRRQTGGEGSGPGEFKQLTSLSVGPGDSLYAYDATQRRVAIFSPSGDLTRTTALTNPPRAFGAEYVGGLADGAIIAAYRIQSVGKTGLSRDSLAIYIHSADGDRVKSIATFPHVVVHWGPHDFPGSREAMTVPLPVPFSSVTSVSSRGDSIYVATADQLVLTVLTPASVLRITRHPIATPRVSEEHRKMLFESLGRAMRGPQAEVLKALRGVENLPVFGSDALSAQIGRPAMLVTSEGNVWLRPFSVGSSPDSLWPVFDSRGRYAGLIALPEHYRATAVRGDVVLGVFRDSTDAEVIRAYRLRATQQ